MKRTELIYTSHYLNLLPNWSLIYRIILLSEYWIEFMEGIRIFRLMLLSLYCYSSDHLNIHTNNVLTLYSWSSVVLQQRIKYSNFLESPNILTTPTRSLSWMNMLCAPMGTITPTLNVWQREPLQTHHQWNYINMSLYQYWQRPLKRYIIYLVHA